MGDERLDDLLVHGLRLVVCGTAAGHRSAQLRHYYAGRGNQFWQTLYDVRLTTRKLEPHEYELLREFGIGLTDIVKDQSGNDSDIKFKMAGGEALEKRILEFQPRVLCFNGKRAAKEFFRGRDVAYGPQDKSIGVTKLFVAPSASGAARRFFKLAMWETLAEIVAQGVR